MRAKIERWQGELGQAWWIPRPADATLPSAQFRRIPLGHRVFSPRPSSRRWPDATASRCAPLLVGDEKTTGVAIHTSYSTAC